MAVFFCHMTIKPLLSVGFFCKDAWLAVFMIGFFAQNVSVLKGENVHFPNSRGNQVNGDYTRTKKLKQSIK